MMGALLRNSFTIDPKGLELSHKNQRFLAKTKKKDFIHCQSGRNVTKSDKFAPVLPERSTPKIPSHGTTIIDSSGGLVMSPNGKNSGDQILVKDLTPPYNGVSTTLGQVQEGIGIVKFLREKTFFVTGATGFLAKGAPNSLFL